MWCSNCQSSECPCVSDDYDETYLHDEDYIYEDEQDPQELEKATWIAENQQLNNNL